jgi:hypothetical protein
VTQEEYKIWCHGTEDEYVNRTIKALHASGVVLNAGSLVIECRRARQAYARLATPKPDPRWWNWDLSFGPTCSPTTVFWQTGRRP